jgi:hypothetical protein
VFLGFWGKIEDEMFCVFGVFKFKSATCTIIKKLLVAKVSG